MIKDHTIAQVVNDLRDTAIKFHDTQQLRERLRGCIEPLLAAPSAQGDEHVLTRAELAAYRKMAYVEGVSVGAAQGDAKDAERLEFIENGTFDLRCYNDHDDDVYWNVIEHHMAAPIEREIGWGNTARQALNAAIAAKAAS